MWNTWIATTSSLRPAPERGAPSIRKPSGSNFRTAFRFEIPIFRHCFSPVFEDYLTYLLAEKRYSPLTVRAYGDDIRQ